MMLERDRPIDIPLHEDEVRVTRRAVGADYGSDQIPANAFQELEIEIPLRAEEIEISTRPVVREVVVVSKGVRERDMRVNH